ncbi:CapA family protein [Aliivibrio fischeri]|uniref:CapA family protein n=1 Tax=Aliivibrio fischeri TaxID=668 RepID=UPI00107E6F21|nr:CapA family protein [Aliivibrio fischeri]TGA73342.1 CapA family protein [Aliivibrio fischeri]
MFFVGDVCTNEYSSDVLSKFKSSDIYSLLNNYDGYVIANIEAPFLDENLFINNNKASFINNVAFYQYIDFIDIFNLSNNHIMDQGSDGLLKSIDNIEKLEKKYFGAGLSLLESRKPIIVDFEGYKVALFSYCCYSSNSESYAKVSSPGPAPLVYEYVKQDIDEYRDSVDFIIILPHWGIEHENQPTYDQVILARRLIDIGADAIIGTHTHTIQSFESYKGKSIYYSLGNFLMNDFQLTSSDKYYWSNLNKETMLLEMSICDGDLRFEETYLKLNQDMLPEVVSVDKLITNIDKINTTLVDKTSKLKHENYEPNLELSLKFNGKSMQIINTSKLVSSNFNGKIISLKTKVKRVVMNKLRKIL